MLRHSPMGPSSLERRGLCPGSYRLEKDLPDQPNEYSTDGDEKHALVATILGGETVVAKEDQLTHVEICVGIARNLMKSMPDVEMLVEHELDMTSLHPLCEVGTLDFALVVPFRKGILRDWKFGHLEPTEAKRNPQIAAYAIALMLKYQLTEVEVGVVCPAQDKQSVHTFTAAELMEIAKILRDVIEASAAPWAPLVPSDDACRYCKAFETCPAVSARAVELVKITNPLMLEPAQIGAILDNVKPAKKLLGQFEKRAMELAMAGVDIPGWELGTGRPTRVWRPEVTIDKLKATAKKLKKPVGDVTVKTKPRMATLPALEKKWGKSKAVRDAFKGLWESKPGSPKLVRKKEEKDA